MPTLTDVLARTLVDAGVELCTYVPGHGATAAFEAFRSLGRPSPISFHEEVAFSVAFGAALRGRRAATFIKTHGVLKAANAISAALSSGTTAALVVGVFDDPKGRHSDNILHVEPILRGLELPFARCSPDDVETATHHAIEQSERSGLPFALVVSADDASAQARDDLPASPLPPLPAYRKEPARHLVSPPLTTYQRAVLDAKLGGGDPSSVSIPKLPRVPEDFPAAWHATLNAYRPIYDELARRRPAFVSGDTGLASLCGFPPFELVDAIHHLGGSVPIAVGAALAGPGPVWAVCGDFAFVSAGHLGLIEAELREVELDVAIFLNGRSEATGGQPVPKASLERLLGGWRDSVSWVEDATDKDALQRAFDRPRRSKLRIHVLDVRRALGAAAAAR